MAPELAILHVGRGCLGVLPVYDIDPLLRAPNCMNRLASNNPFQQIAMPSQQQTEGGFTKRHISGSLKHMTDPDQRAKALQTAAKFRKAFEDKKWNAVKQRIQDAVDEHPLRLEPNRRSASIETNPPPPCNLVTSTSAPPSVSNITGARPSPINLPRLNTYASFTSPSAVPRERWDIIPPGPMTPLSPSPRGNAFSQGGFWEGPSTLTPKTPVAEVPKAPVFAPSVPVSKEAQATYELVRAEIKIRAWNAYTQRTSVYSKVSTTSFASSASGSGAGDGHEPLVTLADEIAAAKKMLEDAKAASQETAIDPRVLEEIAREEAKIIEEYSIHDRSELDDSKSWSHKDIATSELVTILDAQRDMIRMLKLRRKSQMQTLTDDMMRLAWATCMSEDMERFHKMQESGEIERERLDGGYSYNNFMRTFKRPESLSSDSSPITAVPWMSGPTPRGSGTAATPTPSASPFNARSRETSFSTSSDRSSPEKKKRPSLTNKGLCLITSEIKEEEEEDDGRSKLSPVDKAFRHRGASYVELSHWANQLKDFEVDTEDTEEVKETGPKETEYEEQLDESHIHPAFRTVPTQPSPWTQAPTYKKAGSTENGSEDMDGRRSPPSPCSTLRVQKSRLSFEGQPQGIRRKAIALPRTPQSGPVTYSSTSTTPVQAVRTTSPKQSSSNARHSWDSIQISPRNRNTIRGASRQANSPEKGCESSRLRGDGVQEDEWQKELERMESVEVRRQLGE